MYNLIRRVEVHRLPIGSDDWGKRGRPTTTNETITYKNTASKQLFPPQFYSDYTNRTCRIPSQFENPTTEDKEPNIRYDDSKDISELARDEYLENGVDYEPAIRKNVLRRKGWKDSLVMRMIPVKFQDDLEKLSDPRYTMYHQIDLDVCLYVGYCRNYPHHISRLDKILLPDYVEDELLKRTYRLYFCPKDFAPPINLI